MKKLCFPASALCAILLASCSFDYGDATGGGSDLPEISMEEVEYVRVRSGEPRFRFRSREASRYEKKRLMAVKEASFEQFGEELAINAQGKAGEVSMELDTGNLRITEGVLLEIVSEDIAIETAALSWEDKERRLAGDEEAAVTVTREDGTRFEGRGFSADVRRRAWSFSGGASGTYHYDADAKAADDDEVSASAEANDGDGTHTEEEEAEDGNEEYASGTALDGKESDA